MRTGQEIFADGFIVEGEISVNNAAINGETKECRKIPSANYKHVKTTSTAAYTDQCSLFAGTVIMSGEGKMIVTDVGVNTVNGDTLVKMQTLEPPKTALDIALDHLCDFISKWGTIAAVLAFVIMTITGILNAGSLSQYFSGNILENIQKVAQNISNALTIIVAAVPEGLPLIVKLVTKQNVSTMEKFNILAKNTGKIPELAYVNLICTDKTGTLTTGEMTSTVMINGNCQDIFNKESSLNELIDLNICMNNSAVFDSNGNITGGNSIDRAVLNMLSPEDAQKIQNKAIMKKRVPFSSENKFSAVTLNNGANDFTVYKGAPEKLIEKCKFYLDNDGIATELTEEKRKALKSHIKGLTEKAMRCIALTISDKTDDGLPDEMNLLGVIGVVDPVRNEVPEAVKIAHKAGIQVIEITGDCMETAKAVAMEAGIYKPGDLAVTNDEFEAMSDVKVKEIIPQLRVISRCSPNTKLRLVTLAQEIGMSVAMTGDGVNDAPALKNAAIEKKEDELQQENVRYQQMLGKISNYEDDLFHLKKDAMKADVNVNACVDRGDDEAAKVYLKEQQELNDKIDFIKNTLKEWKENADVQKEKVEVLQQQLNDLKAEKESAVLTLETAQASKAFNVTPGVSSSEEEKMLEKVRDGVKKQKEAADGARIVYESSAIVQKQRLDKKMKDDEIDKKLQELKAKKGK